MPRIPDLILDSVVYLYPSSNAAAAGKAIGGSGFLVHLPSKYPGWGTLYVVTNSHVIREGKSPVVRLNTKTGKTVIHEYQAEEWLHHPEGDDLAVAPIALSEAHRYMAIPLEEMCVTTEFIADKGVGPGDEVFMVGRFVNHEGHQQNSPSVRFGAIAQMNTEPIRSERGVQQESFLVEGHSIPGYSGSPVFLFLNLAVPRPESSKGISIGQWFIRLLGIDWCHLNQDWPVRERSGEWVRSDDGDTPRYHVTANTGMMGVVPAWKLWDLLNDERLIALRDEGDRQIAEITAKRAATEDGSA